jgi:hypothetical protein
MTRKKSVHVQYRYNSFFVDSFHLKLVESVDMEPKDMEYIVISHSLG